ncbi:uncharacterized protein LOC133290830 [Gastrolobium bilobum]|uniref:uncharacterized protein LOC133290830 n=1 Tax=Gastrolobium bilobum TaxID=150636 RepID=UPI002AAF7D99|nr:uncharacterized protein LOC133290830 [Gastrolobium bilobum]
MERFVFNKLCMLMAQKGWLANSRYIRFDEQLGIFLYLIGHESSNRNVCERFQRSGQTISKYFSKVLNEMLQLAREIIKPPPFDMVPKEIKDNPKHFPYFKDCIGAIDGTHVSATLPENKQIPFRGRKQITTQNVMCACSFDMKFTFVYAGWEGSANDCRIFSTALETPRLEFPHPPPGKFYVVDSRYPTRDDYFTPFKGERYHLNDYRGRRNQPRSTKELFNHRHSSLRNVIERSFGALKNRFPILRKMPSFSFWKQALIVIACCAVHNIRDHQIADKNLAHYANPNIVASTHTYATIDDEGSSNQVTQIDIIKKNIANQLAIDNQLPPI